MTRGAVETAAAVGNMPKRVRKRPDRARHAHPASPRTEAFARVGYVLARQLAELMDVNRATVYRWLSAGRLSGARDGAAVYVAWGPACRAVGMDARLLPDVPAVCGPLPEDAVAFSSVADERSARVGASATRGHPRSLQAWREHARRAAEAAGERSEEAKRT